MLKNHKYCAFVLWALTKASHKTITVLVGCQPVTLQPGQFVFGRRMAADELGMTEQEIRTIIGLAKKVNFSTNKSTNKFSIITIINWHIYQCQDADCQPTDQPTTNQQLTTNKNVKNEKKEKPPAPDFSQISFLLKKYPAAEIARVFLAISSTRKCNAISDSVKLAILNSWERYPVEQVMAGVIKYLDKGYAADGKDENYLLGIIRNANGSGNGQERKSAAVKASRSSGSVLLDQYYRNEEINRQTAAGNKEDASS